MTPDKSERLLDVVMTAVCVAVVALLLVKFASVVSGAPVPERPKELTPKMMVGRWDYCYSSYGAGAIWLHADSTYSAIHVLGSQTVYHGTYAVKGDTVTLTEWAFDAETVTNTGPNEYRFQFDVSKYPALIGKSNGWVEVKFSNPKR